MARFPLIILVFVLSWTLPSYAQAPSPYRAPVLSKGNQIQLQVFGLGLTEIRLSSPQQVTFHGKTVETYRGRATVIQREKRTSRKRTEAISAVGYRDSRGRKHLEVSFLNSSRMYRVHLNSRGTARIARGPLVSHFECGHPSHSHAVSTSSRSFFTNVNTRSLTPREFREVEVAIDLDYEAKELLGERLVPSVVATVENANLFFERDLGVHLTLKNINPDIRQGSYPANITTIPDLLDSFRVRLDYLGKADVYYLLVGRDTTGTVVGMAAQGLGCNTTRTPELSHATSRYTGHEENSFTLAHEIAHLLWAAHTKEPGLMSTVRREPYFEDIVKQDVAYLLSLSVSDCLSRVSLVPQPTPTATPTPTPTSTPYPTAVPTATPVPDVLPPVTRLKMSKDGTLAGGVDVPEVRDGCSLSIHASSDGGSVRGTKPIISVSPVSSAYTLSGKVTRRIHPLAFGGRKVYVGAKYLCPGLYPKYSKVVALDMRSVRKGAYTNYAGWFKHLTRVLKLNQS